MEELKIWENESNISQIKKIFAPTLTDLEFQMFVGLGKATGLNPFNKEMWAVKYGSGAAQIFVGRDGYRRAALCHPDYDYHQSDAVYENDSFEIVNGEVKHSYNLKDRGKLFGAYCITKRKSASKSVYHFARFSEYNTSKALWVSKPETMIKKVSEAQALRASFQDLLGGTYCPEEMPEEMSIPKNMGHALVDDSEPCLLEQVTHIMDLIYVKEIPEERVAKALSHYKVDRIEELTKSQATEVISRWKSL